MRRCCSMPELFHTSVEFLIVMVVGSEVPIYTVSLEVQVLIFHLCSTGVRKEAAELYA